MEQTKTVQFIQGYYRNKNEDVPKNKEDGSIVIAGALGSLALIVIAVMVWQFVVVVAASGGVSYGAKKYFEHKNDPDRLVINHYK